MNRRPQLQLLAPDASPEETAAIVAALEQFMRDTAPMRAVPEPPASRWKQTALREGVSRQPDAPAPWL